jgi:hypothetical protein
VSANNRWRWAPRRTDAQRHFFTSPVQPKVRRGAGPGLVPLGSLTMLAFFARRGFQPAPPRRPRRRYQCTLRVH